MLGTPKRFSKPQSEGYAPDKNRLVDFMGSYPPGDMALGELRGPMREETDSWLNRVALGVDDEQRAETVIAQVVGKRLTYKAADRPA